MFSSPSSPPVLLIVFEMHTFFIAPILFHSQTQTYARFHRHSSFAPFSLRCYRQLQCTDIHNPLVHQGRIHIHPIMAASKDNDAVESSPGPGFDCVANIEAAFIKACSPGNMTYEEDLKIFIQAVIDAYRKGYELSVLELELSMLSKKTLSRPLQQDEVQFRSIWLSLVYKCLRFLNYPKESDSNNESASGAKRTGSAFSSTAVKVPTSFMPPDSFDIFVKNIGLAYRNGYDLKRIQLEQSALNDEKNPRSDMETAVLRQSTRIVYYTLEIVSDR